MRTRHNPRRKNRKQAAAEVVVSYLPMVDTVELESNMDIVKDSTKGRFVSKVRRLLGREADAQRRGDLPN